MPGPFAGIGAAYWSTQLLRALRPGVASFHAAVYGGAVLAVALIAVAGVWWPARRVVRIDPLLALRSE